MNSNGSVFLKAIDDWKQVEIRIRAALQTATLPFDSLQLHVTTLPCGYSHCEIKTPRPSYVRRLLEAELGAAFVVRYHTHPHAYPRDVVYVFPADHAWSDETFTSSNVSRR